MIIKIIPETDIEKAKHKAIEFSGVKEFFLVGNRKDEDGYMIDFHEWEGSYRYLLTSLHWFYKVIDDEREESSAGRNMLKSSPNMTPISQINPMIKKGQVANPNIQILNPRPFPPDEQDEPNRGGDAFQDDEPQEPNQELTAEDVAAEDIEEKPTIPQIGKIFGGKPERKISMPPKPPKKGVNITREQLDDIVKNANKKFSGQQQAGPEEEE